MKYYAMLEAGDRLQVGDEWVTMDGAYDWRWRTVPADFAGLPCDLNVDPNRIAIRRAINMDEMIHNSQGKIETKATGRKITLYGSTVDSKKHKKAIQQRVSRSDKSVQRRKSRSSRSTASVTF